MPQVMQAGGQQTLRLLRGHRPVVYPDQVSDQRSVGDTPADVLAGLLAGVPVIGFANKPGKAQALAQAGARAVTSQLSEISTALRAAPQPGDHWD